MRRRLASFFSAERLRRGLSVQDVASLLGYTKNIVKGARRIERFEADGVGSREFVQRLFAALDLDLASVEAEIDAEMRREREAWLADWLSSHASHPVADVFVIRCFSAFYSTKPLPPWIVTPGQAVQHVRAFAISRGLEVCLPLSSSLSIYFDHQGNVNAVVSRDRDEPNLPNVVLK